MDGSTWYYEDFGVEYHVGVIHFLLGMCFSSWACSLLIWASVSALFLCVFHWVNEESHVLYHYECIYGIIGILVGEIEHTMMKLIRFSQKSGTLHFYIRSCG